MELTELLLALAGVALDGHCGMAAKSESDRDLPYWASEVPVKAEIKEFIESWDANVRGTDVDFLINNMTMTNRRSGPPAP